MRRPLTWAQPEDLLRHELAQLAVEHPDGPGAERVAAAAQRWHDAGGAAGIPHAGTGVDPADRSLRALADALLDELADLAAPADPGQPDNLPALQALTSAALQRFQQPSGTTADALRGAWRGRAAGCVLGKPVEKLTRPAIDEIRRATGRDPLRRYFTAVGLPADIAARHPWNTASGPTSLEENIDGTPEDDDLNYTLMALRLLERCGAAVTSADVADGWLADLPAGRTFTAERVAYRNLLQGLEPPATAVHRNPFREWIGAQIRTDLYGWVAPGDVRTAVSLAHRDAAVSHTRNGIHTAVAVAAMAATAVRRDPAAAGIDEVLDAGLAAVPPDGLTAQALRFGRDLAASGVRPEDAYPQLEERYAGLHWVHALNNTALVAYALAHGRGDLATSIGTVVSGGWDTDSNGATVGALVGALGGAGAVDEYWTRPLHDRLRTSLPGEDGTAVDTLVDRTLALVGRCGEPAGRTDGTGGAV